MNILIVLLPLSTLLAAAFLFLFSRAVKDGQFDDLDDAALRLLDSPD